MARWGWTGAIQPRLRAQANRTPNLNNTEWKIDEPPVRFQIAQNGDKLACTASYGPHGERGFRYKGFMRGDQLVLTWEEVKLDGLNIGGMVLKLSANAKQLKGFTTYLHRDKGVVISDERTFDKILH